MKTLLLFLLVALNTVFCVAQISNDSLVLYLRFDGNANDFSGNANHGTQHFTVSDTNRFGQLNTAFRFNGTDSYVSIPASPSMNLIQKSNKVTISAWINIFQWHISGNVFSIFERYNPTTDAGWQFEANWVPGGYLFLANENTPIWVGCAAPTPFHQWQHVALTYDKTAGQVKVYINGQMVCDKVYSQPINVGDTTTSFAIGRSLSGPDEFSDGLIDDLKVFCRVLNANEIGVISYTHPVRREEDSFRIEFLPDNGGWNVVFDNDLQPSHLEITNMHGRQVNFQTVSSLGKTVRLPTLPAGMYMIRIPGFSSKKWVVPR